MGEEKPRVDDVEFGRSLAFAYVQKSKLHVAKLPIFGFAPCQLKLGFVDIRPNSPSLGADPLR